MKIRGIQSGMVAAYVSFSLVLVTLVLRPVWAVYTICSLALGLGAHLSWHKVRRLWDRIRNLVVLGVLAGLASVVGLLWVSRSGQGVFPFTVIEQVDYRGLGTYDDDLWFIQHELLLDSAQAEIVIRPLGPLRIERTNPTLRAALIVLGWEEAGRQGQKAIFRRVSLVFQPAPWHRPGVIDSVVVPTLGRRLPPALILVASGDSELVLRAPNRSIVATYPEASSREQMLGTGLEEVTIPIPRREDETTAVRVVMAGALFRNSVTSPIARATTWEGVLWVLVSIAAVIGWLLSPELDRRVRKPLSRWLFNSLAVPEPSDEAGVRTTREAEVFEKKTEAE